MCSPFITNNTLSCRFERKIKVMKIIKVIKINGLYYAIKPVDIVFLASLIIIIASIIIPIVAGIISYSNNKQTLSSGTIEDKWYKSGYVYYYKTGQMRTIEEIPDKWYFTISNGDDTDTFSVDENVYNDYEIGDTYPKET